MPFDCLVVSRLYANHVSARGINTDRHRVRICSCGVLGQSALPSSCPVCEHSPLSAEDCNPNKSLRTTIRVFLRTAEKKKEASRPKQPAPAIPAVEPKTRPAEAEIASASDGPAKTSAEGQAPRDNEKAGTSATLAQKDAPAGDEV
jgi:hypothetical protein